MNDVYQLFHKYFKFKKNFDCLELNKLNKLFTHQYKKVGADFIFIIAIQIDADNPRTNS